MSEKDIYEDGEYSEREAPGEGLANGREKDFNPAKRDEHAHLDNEVYEVVKGLTGVDEGTLVDLPAGGSDGDGDAIGQISKLMGEPGDENWLWRTRIHHKQLEFVIKLMYWDMYAPDARPVVNEFKKNVLPDLLEGLTSVGGESRKELTEILSPLFTLKEIENEGENKRNTGAITFNYNDE